MPLIDQAAKSLDALSRREWFTDPEDIVFADERGVYLNDGQLRDRFIAAVAKAKLPRLRFRDLRHTFGTLAVQVFPLSDVKEYMGLADIATSPGVLTGTPSRTISCVSSRLLGAISLACVLGLAGCGGGSNKGGGGTTTTAGESAETVVVEETEFRMNPSTIRLTAGTTYNFKGVNKGKIPHALEIEGPGLENETGRILPGGSETIQLIMRNPGNYEFYCPLDHHKQKGMVAKFIVKRG